MNGSTTAPRPLLGGIDAWVQAGQPVERALPSASV